MSTNNAEIFVGIDVSKEHLDVEVRPEGSKWRAANDPQGIGEVVNRLSKLAPTMIVVEATGGLERAVTFSLMEAKLPVAVVNPRQVRDFAKATGRLAKTDSLDAGVLAHFGEAIRPELRTLPDKAQIALQDLVARRQQLVHIRTAESNRLTLSVSQGVRANIQKHIAWLNRQIKTIEKEIDKTIRSNPIWSARAEILETATGVGQTTSNLLVARLPQLGHASRQEIAALAGLAPFNRESGFFDGRRVIWGGRAEVRTALYMATLSAIRFNPRFKAFYQRLLLKGKKPKVAITACMRKLLVILNSMLRSTQPYDHECAKTA